MRKLGFRFSSLPPLGQGHFGSAFLFETAHSIDCPLMNLYLRKKYISKWVFLTANLILGIRPLRKGQISAGPFLKIMPPLRPVILKEKLSLTVLRLKEKLILANQPLEKRLYITAIFKKAVDLSKVLFEESLEIIGSNPPDRLQKKMRQINQFNLSHEMDRTLKKKFSRRQVLRGLFRFLPEDKEK